MSNGLLQKRVRKYLHEYPDGATVSDISRGLDRTHTDTSIRRALAGMPDAYIDRWSKGDSGPYAAVWAVVRPPEDCPKPSEPRTFV